MMEEVSIMMAFDADAISQMTEEEILATLVAEALPQPMVPSKKLKLRLSQELLEDPIEKYHKENQQLQKASLRLEQENDSLAHNLVATKISLRASLDEAEDRVDKLTKELLKTRKHLQESEEEKGESEEATAKLKEVLRRELDKAEAEIKRSTCIIGDYKQICTRLNNTLERQEAAHRDELNAIQSTVSGCPRCREAIQKGLPEKQVAARLESSTSDEEKARLGSQVRELEQELAKTKLQMAEANCTIQALEHQKKALVSELQAAKNSWFSKTLGSMRTAGSSLQGAPREGGKEGACEPNNGPLSGWSSRRLSWRSRDKKGAEV